MGIGLGWTSKTSRDHFKKDSEVASNTPISLLKSISPHSSLRRMDSMARLAHSLTLPKSAISALSSSKGVMS